MPQRLRQGQNEDVQTAPSGNGIGAGVQQRSNLPRLRRERAVSALNAVEVNAIEFASVELAPDTANLALSHILIFKGNCLF
jgi:hypothetical protein